MGDATPLRTEPRGELAWIPAANALPSLRSVLRVDAALCFALAAALLAGAQGFAPAVFVDGSNGVTALRGAGAGTFAVGLIVACLASRRSIPARGVAALVGAEVGVVLLGIPLVAAGPALTLTGLRAVLVGQVIVLGLAYLELAGVAVETPVEARAGWRRAGFRLLGAGLAVGVLLGGVLAFAPSLGDAFFHAVLFRGAPPAEAVAMYPRFVSRILGAAILGWMAVSASAALALRGEENAAVARLLHRGLLLGVMSWFFVDTTVSCLTGYDANGISNAAFLAALLLPLALLHPAPGGLRTVSPEPGAARLGGDLP